MKVITYITTVSILISLNIHAEYKGSTFSEVWETVKKDEYELPENRISYKSLKKWFQSKIKFSANRTLSERQDILPHFEKLVHPNGICLAGKWKMTEDNPYGGYFRKGSEALIITRASTAMSETKVGKFRGMALAGKIFPTLEEDKKVETASFFLVDDLGGTKAKHWTDVEMTNAPKTSATSDVLKHLLYVLKVARTFAGVDKNPNERQVYMISELGEPLGAKIRTPRWMMVKAAPGQTVDEEDFRNELKVENYGGKLNLEVYGTSTEKEDGTKDFKKLGVIELTESVVSESCDHRLHFFHPKWKEISN